MISSGGYDRFGDIDVFALDLCLMPDPDDDERAPSRSVGSWGAWRLWVRGHNLCDVDLATAKGIDRIDCVRWYLAPLMRWLSASWDALTHEARLPEAVPNISNRFPDARGTYLSCLSRIGDDERFEPWQAWAFRHALRTCAEGGIVPDVFFRRFGDEMEISWGDRIAPGAEAAQFVLEDGIAHVDVDSFASTIDAALSWFVSQPAVRSAGWLTEFLDMEAARRRGSAGERLAWFVDGPRREGGFGSLLTRSSEAVRAWLAVASSRPWLAPLAPEVAMFGALSPRMRPEAAVELLAILGTASGEDSGGIGRFVEDLPAWKARSPWDQGYELAREILEEADVHPGGLATDVEGILRILDVTVEHRQLGPDGPRGVAIAGPGFRSTIVVNENHVSNQEARGRRFTLAHEFCHLLYDRDRARSVFHTSTPWAHASVEQRANAFAAMLLMPPKRIERAWPGRRAGPEKGWITALSESLGVGRVALIHHLANLDYIDEIERDRLLGQRYESGYPP